MIFWYYWHKFALVLFYLHKDQCKRDAKECSYCCSPTCIKAPGLKLIFFLTCFVSKVFPWHYWHKFALVLYYLHEDQCKPDAKEYSCCCSPTCIKAPGLKWMCFLTFFHEILWLLAGRGPGALEFNMWHILGTKFNTMEGVQDFKTFSWGGGGGAFSTVETWVFELSRLSQLSRHEFLNCQYWESSIKSMSKIESLVHMPWTCFWTVETFLTAEAFLTVKAFLTVEAFLTVKT